MGVSTDGQICYGILFPEDFEFPWDDEKFGGDVRDWWLVHVMGYKEPFRAYSDDGESMPGIDDAKIREYFSHRSGFEMEKGPPLVQAVNVCSGSYPEWVVALRSTCLVANRGNPVSFNPESLHVSDTDRDELIRFCEEYIPDPGDEYPELVPKWYLSSCWVN